jgi:hypothetical protein
MKMDPDAFQLMLGLLFADGHLSRSRRPRGYSYRATFMNGVGEKQLLEEKLFEVRKCLPTRAEIDQFTVKGALCRDSEKHLIRKRGSLVYRFRVSSNHLEGHWRLLHPQGFREITSPLLERLGARAAAWLWSENVKILPEDDGDGAAVLRRVGRRGDEAEMVSEWLARLTGARSRISLEKRTPRLLFDRGNRELLQATLHPVAPFHSRWLFKA